MYFSGLSTSKNYLLFIKIIFFSKNILSGKYTRIKFIQDLLRGAPTLDIQPRKISKTQQDDSY
jgi:hypothetical protein